MSSPTLIVRDAQMEVFLTLERQKFLDEILALLRSDYPEHLDDSPPAQAREQVAALIARAEALDFHLHSDVVQFVILALILGPDFENKSEYAAVRDLLHDADIEPAIRLTRVRHLLDGDADELSA